jgi:hypothetical protein
LGPEDRAAGGQDVSVRCETPCLTVWRTHHEFHVGFALLLVKALEGVPLWTPLAVTHLFLSSVTVCNKIKNSFITYIFI